MNKIANRAVMCEVLMEHAAKDRDVVVLCSDSRGSASLAPYAERFFCVTPPSPRALAADKLAELVNGMGIPAQSCGEVQTAAALALSCGKPVIACGSLYLAGTARDALLSIIRGEKQTNG